MKISVMTVCFNSEKTIRRTIQSVLNQTTPAYEYIIIDGFSTDHTIEIAYEYIQEFKKKNVQYRVISEKDSGIYNAMNKGLKLCQGDYIGIINSDDWYEENAISKIVSSLNGNLVDVVYGMIRQYEGDYELKVYRNSHQFITRSMIPHPTCFVSKCAYEKYGYFDESYRSAADYELMLRFFINRAEFLGLNTLIANFSSGGISSTTTGYIETYKILYMYGLINKQKYNKKINRIRRQKILNQIKSLFH